MTRTTGKKDTTTSPLCLTAAANTVVSDQDQEPIRIWILTCWWFLTVGILPGSWWAYHELNKDRISRMNGYKLSSGNELSDEMT
ncbi:hypothetical protein ES288_D10G199200v1 [Gossypium darwinii]|uniref:Uncharacterized protein n=1 Tax=Gossypium darwinii TaxID=34276 RepID=A0A5D2B1R7_GOSDA|nr:hypothetical protein ES288_D10G199200v1 [Gossypium darwinii]